MIDTTLAYPVEHDRLASATANRLILGDTEEEVGDMIISKYYELWTAKGRILDLAKLRSMVIEDVTGRYFNHASYTDKKSLPFVVVNPESPLVETISRIINRVAKETECLFSDKHEPLRMGMNK